MVLSKQNKKAKNSLKKKTKKDKKKKSSCKIADQQKLVL